MPRELRIAATVEVPDDIFAGADKGDAAAQYTAMGGKLPE